MTPEPTFKRLLDRLRFGPRARLALELDERGARLLLVKRSGNDVLVVEKLAADLRADGLVGPGEMAARLRSLLAELPDSAPATLVLPAGRTHSQLMSLRDGESRAAADLARVVGGRQFDAVPSVFDARPLRPAARHPRPVWVSIAREADVELHLLRCGLPAERVAAVVGADAALAAAFTTLPQRPPLAVLVELGATAGLLVVVENDQPVFAADLDWGVAQIVSALAADLGLSSLEAEAILARDGAELLGTRSAPRVAAVLRGLKQAVESLLRDHAREAGQAAEHLLSAPRWVSGDGLDSGHSHELFARALAGPVEPARAWPVVPIEAGGQHALNGGVLAYGSAAIALGLADAPPNLAPPALRAARRAEAWTAGLQAAALALAAVGLLVAALTLHARYGTLRDREAEAAALREARAVVAELLRAREDREIAYVEALPGLYFQKRTRDFIAATRLLREQRGNGDFWFALVADTETYQAGSLPQGSPSAAPETQLLALCLARPSGLVVELSFRPGGEDPLAKVGALIAELRDTGDFARVDILPARARQTALADRAVFAADGADFALQLETFPFDGVVPASALPAASGTLFGAPPR